MGNKVRHNNKAVRRVRHKHKCLYINLFGPYNITLGEKLETDILSTLPKIIT